jgi:hypothetical protein
MHANPTNPTNPAMRGMHVDPANPAMRGMPANGMMSHSQLKVASGS